MDKIRPQLKSEVPGGLLPRLKATRKLIVNMCMVLLSLAVAGASAEVILRIIAPKYQRAADVNFEVDSFRLKSRTPLTAVSYPRPDTGEPVSTLYNSLGLRQHREFTARQLDHRTIIAFFGDSYTENSLIPVYTSFTEVLDFLLNSDSDDLIVMNFGVSGYGTDQSYLQYRNSNEGRAAAHVLYVFCANDVRNLHENALFSLDKSGSLHLNVATTPSPVLRVISRLYLTYFVLDAISVLRSAMMGAPHWSYTGHDVLAYHTYALRRKNFHSPRADQIEAQFKRREWGDVSYYLDMLLAIAGAWADLVEQDGGRFHVVLLPREEESIAEDLFENRFSVINLYEIFSGARPGYKYDMIRFREDRHWDETGNMLAAIALYREISKVLGRTAASEQTIAARLRTYYSAFDGWYPAQLAPRLPFSAELQVIRDRYLALETEKTGGSAGHAKATDAGRVN